MRKKMLVVLMLACVASCSLVAGCVDGSVDPNDVKNLAGQVEVLNEVLDKYQASTGGVIATLQASGLLDPNLAAKVAKVSAEIDRVQGHVAPIAASIQETPLTGDQLNDFIAILAVANQASKPFNPYAVIIDISLAVIAGVMTLLTALGAKKNKKTTDALVEVVANNEQVKKVSSEVRKAFTANQKQSASTQLQVAAIRQKITV